MHRVWCRIYIEKSSEDEQHIQEKKILFCSRSVGSIFLKWSSKETYAKSVVQDLQREVI